MEPFQLHLVPRLRMCEGISPLPHTSQWGGGQLSTGTTSPLPFKVHHCSQELTTESYPEPHESSP